MAGVEIVLDQHDVFDPREMLVAPVFAEGASKLRQSFWRATPILNCIRCEVVCRYE